MDSVRGDDGCSTPAQLAISGDTTLPSIESLVIAPDWHHRLALALASVAAGKRRYG